MDCVEVCPVDCFYEGQVMLVINPSECIDCGVCEPECPAEAVLPDTGPELQPWIECAEVYSALWPNVTWNNRQTPPDDDTFKRELGKFARYFSEKPGEGN